MITRCLNNTGSQTHKNLLFIMLSGAALRLSGSNPH